MAQIDVTTLTEEKKGSGSSLNVKQDLPASKTTTGKLRLQVELKANGLNSKGHFDIKMFDKDNNRVERLFGKLDVATFVQLEARADDANDTSAVIAREDGRYSIYRMGTAEFSSGRIEVDVTGQLGVIQVAVYLVDAASGESSNLATAINITNAEGSGKYSIDIPFSKSS